MDSQEKKVADALERLGIGYITYGLDQRGGKCIYCGKGSTDFAVAAPDGWRMFHTDCQLVATGEKSPN